MVTLQKLTLNNIGIKLTLDNLASLVDSIVDYLEEMGSFKPETLSDSRKDQSHEHAPESRRAKNEDSDDNTKNQIGSPAIAAAVNYDVNQQGICRHKRKKQEIDSDFNLPIKDQFFNFTGEVDYFLSFVDAEIRQINKKTEIKNGRLVSAVTNNELFSFL